MTLSRPVLTDMWERYKRRRQSGDRPLSSMGRAQREAYEAGVRDGIALCEGS